MLVVRSTSYLRSIGTPNIIDMRLTSSNNTEYSLSLLQQILNRLPNQLFRQYTILLPGLLPTTQHILSTPSIPSHTCINTKHTRPCGTRIGFNVIGCKWRGETTDRATFVEAVEAEFFGAAARAESGGGWIGY